MERGYFASTLKFLKEQGSCRPEDLPLFFPVGDKNEIESQTSRAKHICASCSVQSECLDYALSAREEIGIWGGATELERKGVFKGSLKIVEPSRSKKRPYKIRKS